MDITGSMPSLWGIMMLTRTLLAYLESPGPERQIEDSHEISFGLYSISYFNIIQFQKLFMMLYTHDASNLYKKTKYLIDKREKYLLITSKDDWKLLVIYHFLIMSYYYHWSVSKILNS